MPRTRTTIPNSDLSILITPGTELKTIIRHPNGTITPLIFTYTENGVFYTDVYYTAPSSLMRALLLIYRSDRRTHEDQGYSSIFRVSDGLSLDKIRAEYNRAHMTTL